MSVIDTLDKLAPLAVAAGTEGADLYGNDPVIDGIVPIPPPCQYWSGRDTTNVWCTMNVQIGLLVGSHGGGPVLCAPVQCYWFTTPILDGTDTQGQHPNDFQLRWFGPTPLPHPDSQLPVALYAPAGPGGFVRGTSVAKKIADGGRFWTIDCEYGGYITGQQSYNFAAQVGNIADQAVAPALMVVGAVLQVIPGIGTAVGAVVLAVGALIKVGLDAAQKGYGPGGFKSNTCAVLDPKTVPGTQPLPNTAPQNPPPPPPTMPASHSTAIIALLGIGGALLLLKGKAP